MFKSTKISNGNYDLSINGRKFEIELDQWNLWLLFEIIDNGREYCQDFRTKRAAVEAAKEIAK